jgi:hypothetical protein
MKQIFFAVFAGIVLFASCKEKDPILVINKGGSSAGDTIYTLTTVPPAQPHNVLVELFSGQSCSNCYKGADALAAMITQSGIGRINAIDYYAGSNGPQTVPPPGVTLDLRSPVADLVAQNIYGGVAGMPTGGVDRVTYSGGLLQGYNSWAADAAPALNMVDSVNLSVTTSFDAGTGTATVVTDITYLQTMLTQQKLSIFLVEDSIYGIQEMSTDYDSSYLYLNVCRNALTQYNGDIILADSTQKHAGLVSQLVYTYKFQSSDWGTQPAWLPQHCKIVAFVTNADGTVMQSASTGKYLTGN